jgi:hypothetical protein
VKNRNYLNNNNTGDRVTSFKKDEKDRTPMGKGENKSDIVSVSGTSKNSGVILYEDKKASGRIDSLAVTPSKESDLVKEMSKRISHKPILLYTTSDSVHIEMYDNGVFDYDTISVIYNGKLTVYKQLLQVDKPISFYAKVDRDERKNEMIFFADNLGLIPPNSALMVITDGEGKRTEVSVTNDMGHNAVIYFIKPKKRSGN